LMLNILETKRFRGSWLSVH